MSTHIREANDPNTGDLIDIYYFCSHGCWRDSFAADRLGPANDSLEKGGAVPCAEDEEASDIEVYCAECGVLMGSPFRPSPVVVNLIERKPLTNGLAPPVDYLEQPDLVQARTEHYLGTWTYDEGGTIDNPLKYTVMMWWDGRTTDGTGFMSGRPKLAYALWANSDLIFAGEDYSTGAATAPDSEQAAADLIGFLSCKPGDVEADYFKDYTPAQLEFAEQHGEELSIWSQELEGMLE